VEAEIDQALGDIFGADAAGFFQRTDVEDAFVRDQAVATGVKGGVVIGQPL
jgi:hypothetical protein